MKKFLILSFMLHLSVAVYAAQGQTWPDDNPVQEGYPSQNGEPNLQTQKNAFDLRKQQAESKYKIEKELKNIQIKIPS